MSASTQKGLRKGQGSSLPHTPAASSVVSEFLPQAPDPGCRVGTQGLSLLFPTLGPRAGWQIYLCWGVALEVDCQGKESTDTSWGFQLPHSGEIPLRLEARLRTV